MYQEKRELKKEPPEADSLHAWPHYADYYDINSRQDLDFRLAHKLVRTARAWTNLIDASLRAETGQSRARWEMLFVIGFSEEPVTMTEVAERLGVQWPTLVRLMNELERDALIARHDNPEDGRSRLVRLTKKGRQTIQQIRSTIDPLRGQLMSALSKQEVIQCTQLLERVRQMVVQLSDEDTASGQAD